MDPLTLLMISQTAGNLVSGIGGGLFGGDSPRIPKYVEDLIMTAYQDRNMTGFLPDKGAYDASLRANIDEIMAGMPVQSEAFEADLASRGIHGAGEAPKFKYQGVYAPIARAATSAAAQSELGYAQAYQRGSIAAEQMRQQMLGYLLQYHQTNTELAYRDYVADQSGIADLFGGIGEFGAYLGFGELFGGGGPGGTLAPAAV